MVRAILALTLATPFFLRSIAQAFNGSHEYSFELDASSSVEGSFQLFYDRGAGITEKDSVKTPIHAGSTFQTIHLPLPSGTFGVFRIDPPGIDGQYGFAGARIRDWDGAVVADIPLASIAPAQQLRLVQPGPPLLYDSPPGSNDPQLLWRPASALTLPSKPGATPTLILTCVGEYLAALIVVWALTLALAPLAKPTERALAAIATTGERHPLWMTASASLVGTVLAMYPLVFLGKSLVSPNNGGAVLLYNHAPFTPGETDLGLEEIRGADNGAGMWAFVPYSQVQRVALSQGELPLWNRYNAAGRPLWGQGQTQILDPLHWVTLITPNVALGWDLKFLLHRFVFAAGVGAAVMAITGSWPAGAAMALMAPFASYFLFRLNHPAQFTLTYASWMMWAWLRLAAAPVPRDRVRAMRWLAVLTALVLVASPPKEAVIVLLCMYATGGLACLLAARTEPRFARLGAGGLAGVAALLLTAPHWLIFLTTLRQSLTDYDVPHARFATWPFAQSIAFGALLPGQLLPGAHAAAAVLWVTALLVGGYTWRHAGRRAIVLGSLLSFAVAFGIVPATVITSIPFLANVYQIDYTFIGAGLVLLLIAGGVGIAGVATASRWSATAIVASCTVASALLIVRGVGRMPPLSLAVEPWAALLAGAPATLLVPVVRRMRRPVLMPLLTSTIAIVLAVIPNGLHAVTHIDRIDDQLIQPRARADFNVHSAAIDAIRQDARGPSRTLGLGELLFPGTQVLYGVEGVGGPDALELPPYEQLINASGVYRYWTWNQLFTSDDLQKLGPLLNLLNVRYLVTGQNAAIERVAPGADGTSPLNHGPDRVQAIRRSTEWPRAFFVERVGSYEDVAEFVAQMNGSDRPFASVDRHDRDAQQLIATMASGGGAMVPATNYRLTANRTTFRVQAPGPGVAVLTESWMANDFVATINDQQTPYFRVNHAFKGVAIPSAGDWTIEFAYRPAWWTVSLILAALGGVVLFGAPRVIW